MLKRARRHTGKHKVDFSASSEFLDAEIDKWVHEERRPMGQILLEMGAITADQLVDALQDQQVSGRRLGEILLERGHVDEHQLAAVLAEQFEIELADLRLLEPHRDAVARVPEDLARKHQVLPLRIEEDDRVALVTGEPLGVEAIRELTLECRRIRILVGAKGDIVRMLDQAYNALSFAEEHIQAFELIELEDDGPDTITLEVDENAPIVQVVNRILIQAVRARASDVHIEPRESQIVVRYRIDGALSVAISLPRSMGPPIASRLKVMSDLNIVERRRPQDGQFSVVVDGRPIDVRISVVGTVHGEKVVLRLLDKTRSLIGLHDLGMANDMLPRYLDIVKAPLGMLLCTGPTGSGKTTTLYATLTEVQDPTRNVVTIEDPVEYQFPGINQMPINDLAGMTFADALRGVLRQDPDVILVGEIRDVETARIATQAALTGHFVLSSLHAVDAVSAVHRFTDMGIEPFLVASAVSGVVGQRLLRRICTACREPISPHPDHIRLTEMFAGAVPDEWTHGVGCNLCNGTGYAGRVGVYELLKVTDTIRDEIVARATAREIRATAMAEGMRTMQQEAFQLVVDGVTTVDDVMRSVYAPGMESEMEELLALTPPVDAADGDEQGRPAEDAERIVADLTERERIRVGAGPPGADGPAVDAERLGAGRRPVGDGAGGRRPDGPAEVPIPVPSTTSPVEPSPSNGARVNGVALPTPPGGPLPPAPRPEPQP